MSYSESERRLTNDDFRKLFMTPRHSGSDSSSAKPKLEADPFVAPATPTSATPGGVKKSDKSRVEDKRQQQKKKHFYQKTKSEEEETLAELAKKYRDRAKERRDGGHPEGQREELITNQGAYRAVAPDFRGNVDAAERRKQLIQESKFLGGDMEHTHLVKGLDYALLQKVRSEIDIKGDLEEEEIEEEVKPEVNKSVEPVVAVAPAPPKKPMAAPEPDSGFRTKLARSVYRTLFQTTLPERNELFAPGRMAYVFDLEDEYAESDIPTTVIRSKADVPLSEGQATLTTNDIVINKLAQILSYLRQGSKSSKKLKKSKEVKAGSSNTSKYEERERDSKKNVEEDSIYGEIGDYVPNLSKSKSRSSDKDRSSKRQPYFEKPAEEDDRDLVLEQRPIIPETEIRKRDREAWSEEGPGGGDQTFGSILKKAEEKSLSRTQKLLSKINEQPEGYAECYPGFDEMHDAIDDSDEETDYSKMDPGKKKGTVGRWDFDTMEEYSEYMSNKEALPKAAFQFGVKMGDGRKTRKGAKTEKNEKQQLDRQWQQIQSILAKRKAAGGGGDGEPDAKTPRV
ncbi:Protein Red [Orchesella cincta]|uniref:Protein Red n=1 Tax=Orchesella cincta TaxID=48709 RepID=A0A1D2MX14_ORCCI|nr:Protein Red [Orchesella cincta]